MSDLLQIDPIELEVGYALIPLVDEKQGGDLLERISMLRKQAAQELGILVPAIRIRDDIRLPANEYVIKLRGSEIARGEVMPRFLLALDTGRVIGSVEGIDTIDPSFGMPARWIAVDEARRGGIARLRRRRTGDGRRDASDGEAQVQRVRPARPPGRAGDGRHAQEDASGARRRRHPGKLTLGVLHRVLQRLLKERVPIRDLVTILEAVADAADQTKDPEVLTEHARRALTNTIARLHMDESGVVRGITIGPKLEMSLLGLFSPRANQSPSTMLTPDSLGALLRELDQHGERDDGRGSSASAARAAVAARRPAPSRRAGAAESAGRLARRAAAVRASLSSVATWEVRNAA